MPFPSLGKSTFVYSHVAGGEYNVLVLQPSFRTNTYSHTRTRIRRLLILSYHLAPVLVVQCPCPVPQCPTPASRRSGKEPPSYRISDRGSVSRLRDPCDAPRRGLGSPASVHPPLFTRLCSPASVHPPLFTRLCSPASITNSPCTDVVYSTYTHCLPNSRGAPVILRAQLAADSLLPPRPHRLAPPE